MVEHELALATVSCEAAIQLPPSACQILIVSVGKRSSNGGAPESKSKASERLCVKPTGEWSQWVSRYVHIFHTV